MEVGGDVSELIKEVELEAQVLFPIVNAELAAVPPRLLSPAKNRTCAPAGSIRVQVMDLCEDVPMRQMI